MRLNYLLILIVAALYSCTNETNTEETSEHISKPAGPYIKVLGVAQDAGYPQANCRKSCCAKVWSGESEKVLVVSLALIDPDNKDAWLFEATPDFIEQLHELEEYNLKGIFLTHGHIGHYTGLMHLGIEAMGAKNVPVYSMPRMAEFLENNGPWSQLVSMNNIEIKMLQNDSLVILNENLSVTPILVPHRDEYTETVGYKIEGPDKSLIFIPDINKWEKMDQDIKNIVTQVDYALLDGSFYDGQELPGRDMSEFPHPFIIESMNLFDDLPLQERSKIHFIHFNHTNPLLDRQSSQSNQVISQGYKLSYQGLVLEL